MTARPAILVVDDEETILHSLKAQLKGMFGRRFTYETAPSVGEAWEILDELADEDVTVVVIVSDWLMPGVRGDEFLANVRRRYPGIVRIMLTGQADSAAIERARTEAQVVRVLFKPWSADELRGTILHGLGEDG
jgi:CheY-like chemotaxis protein